MTCRCDDGTPWAAARVNGGGFAYPLCRNYSIEIGRAEHDFSIAKASGREQREAALEALTDLIAAQLVWWLPKPVQHALPGNARREPELIELARAATELENEIRARVLAEKTEGIGKLHDAAAEARKAIEVDVEWRRRSFWFSALRARVWRYATPAMRQNGRRLQRACESKAWEDARAIPAENVTLNCETEAVLSGGPVVDGFSIGWSNPQPHGLSMGAKVVKVEANVLELDVPKQRRRSRRDPATDRAAGRNFLLSKQRRQHRGPR